MRERTPPQQDENAVTDQNRYHSGRCVDQEHSTIAARCTEKGHRPGNFELRPKTRIAHQPLNARSQIDHAIGIQKKHRDDRSHHVEIAHPDDGCGNSGSHEDSEARFRGTAQLRSKGSGHDTIERERLQDTRGRENTS